MPTPILATKTINKINEMLEADQGALFRKLEGITLPQLQDAYNPEAETFRTHLGASQIGQECARAIWYGFHWVTDKKYKGKIIRLFNRGHIEEGRFVALLLMIGCEIFQLDENGKQYRISHANGHAGGSGDGVALGIPDLPDDTPALTEFKTHGEKSFLSLIESGVRESKFEHYIQTQVYMRKMELDYCLYLAVNKNTDDLYGEIIPLDIIIADQFLDRMEQLVYTHEPPKRINESPGFYKCRFCDHRPQCHNLKDKQIARNCRTCIHSIVREDEWVCTEPNAEMAYGDCPPLSKENQLKGCENYFPNPSI